MIPYWLSEARGLKYAAFFRSESPRYWQWIAGGGRSPETPLQAAQRESNEEAGISTSSKFTALESKASIPVVNFEETGWPDDLDVVPEHSFAVEVQDPVLTLSEEHVEYRWLNYEEAMGLLKWDSNRTALWELQRRLIRDGQASCTDILDIRTSRDTRSS